MAVAWRGSQHFGDERLPTKEAQNLNAYNEVIR
jgi:hypothetical protein